MDRRARRIDDPIERLRYLRARAADPSPQSAIPRRRFASLGIAIAVLPLRGDLLRRIVSSSPRPPAPYRLPSADSPNVWPPSIR